jgi:hypothetical protein
MAYLGASHIMIAMWVDGFEETSPPDPNIAATTFEMRHNISQFLALRVVVKKPTGDFDDAVNPLRKKYTLWIRN